LWSSCAGDRLRPNRGFSPPFSKGGMRVKDFQGSFISAVIDMK
jgi:hypothetical protein